MTPPFTWADRLEAYRPDTIIQKAASAAKVNREPYVCYRATNGHPDNPDQNYFVALPEAETHLLPAGHRPVCVVDSDGYILA